MQLWSLTSSQLLACVSGLVIVSLLVRLINIGELSLWVDEYVHVMRARNVVRGNGSLFTDDNNGILYTIFMLPFNALFGVTPFWSRFPSALFGAGAVLATYLMGRRLVNTYTGYLAAIFMALSLYQIYWSRLARNYAIFVCVFLILLIVFWDWYVKGEKSASNLLSVRKIGFVLGALVLAMLSHQLAFFFLFGFCMYNILMLFNELASRNFSVRSRYFIFGAPSLLIFLTLFIPFMTPLLHSVLSIILPERVATWVIPDWNRLAGLWKNSPLETFTIYNGVFQYDTRYIYLFAIPGIIWGYFKDRKLAIFLVSFLIVPFLLMSFIFREPSLPRYAIYLQPLVFISVSLFLYYVLRSLQNSKWIKYSPIRPWLVIFPFLFTLVPLKAEALANLIKVSKKSGYLVDRRLSQWAFTNWRDACVYLKLNMQPGDVILSTVPQAVNFYMDEDVAYNFRQLNYNTQIKEYVKNEPVKTSEPSAHTADNLNNTMLNYSRGWLLADYYLEGALVDQESRYLVYNNMVYHPSISDGDIKVFSWDESSRNLPYQSIIIDLGRSEEWTVSHELSVGIPANALFSPTIYLQVNAFWIDDPTEASVVINGQYRAYLPVTPSNRIESLTVSIETQYLLEGANTIQFEYNKDCKGDTRKGFIIYQVGFRSTPS